ncbi:MAG: hypothetical protein RSB39_09305 [Oscillospiraceae bacterium]
MGMLVLVWDCDALVSLADKWQSRTPAERSEPRQTQSVPLMAAFHRWPEDVHPASKRAFAHPGAMALAMQRSVGRQAGDLK